MFYENSIKIVSTSFEKIGITSFVLRQLFPNFELRKYLINTKTKSNLKEKELSSNKIFSIYSRIQ